MGHVLSGKELAKTVRADVKRRVSESTYRPPGLTVVMVGEDPASEVYISYKQKACRKVGIESEVKRFSADVDQSEVLAEIDRLNTDDDIDGILVQLPLPNHLSESTVAARVSPGKDVDGLHPVNVGRLWRGESGLFPCTPTGIVELLRHYGVAMDGALAVIVGRSNIVGKPLAALLLRENATVVITHSHTSDLPGLTSSADVLVAAAGSPGMIGPDHVKPGSTVIDVGISRTEEGLKGDVDFDSVIDVSGGVTPVPGGVGPLTIAFLLRNTVQAWMEHTTGR
ncbi:bifunctional methylenetetrahydrofolate dehydrogenase/methenyltetrahydrofolate cyclohydrolase FolD [Candidatus Fermentibacteria bacterium]|nr:bifunctional methylenetetrahydrofolate dehydrogenase/methenyltetrahydrofolate cyclohydrolase FolD [Candidatus Fermentibacteria bacterium]